MFDWKALQLDVHSPSYGSFLFYIACLFLYNKPINTAVRKMWCDLDGPQPTVVVIPTATTGHFNRNTYTHLHSYHFSSANHVAAAPCIEILQTVVWLLARDGLFWVFFLGFSHTTVSRVYAERGEIQKRSSEQQLCEQNDLVKRGQRRITTTKCWHWRILPFNIKSKTSAYQWLYMF